jgi:hypothetical protein
MDYTQCPNRKQLSTRPTVVCEILTNLGVVNDVDDIFCRSCCKNRESYPEEHDLSFPLLISIGMRHRNFVYSDPKPESEPVEAPIHPPQPIFRGCCSK